MVWNNKLRIKKRKRQTSKFLDRSGDTDRAKSSVSYETQPKPYQVSNEC